MNNLDVRYQALLQDILDNGVTKSDRTGTGTISIFSRQIRHKMSEGFPLLTSKKMPFKTIVTELLWFLRGDTNIKYLVDNGCHIWDGDAYKAYLTKETNRTEKNGQTWTPMTQKEFIDKIKTDNEFAKKWGELGPIYGKQWRQWQGWMDMKNAGPNAKGSLWYDQIGVLIHQLKTNPDSRRLMVSAWNVGELDQMVLPPCHYGFQVYTRELSARERTALGSNGSTRLYDSIKEENYKTIDADREMHKVCDEAGVPKRTISLMWNQRSIDSFLGLPFNIASYGLLLEIIAKEVNMVPDELIGNLGDTHLYLNHIEQAKEQIGRELTLKERRDLVNPEMFSQIYTAGDSSTLSHSEIDQWYIPRRTREPFELPKLGMDYREGEYNKNLTDFVPDDFYLIDYQSHPTIKAPLSN